MLSPAQDEIVELAGPQDLSWTARQLLIFRCADLRVSRLWWLNLRTHSWL
jgi:hypothetical protein